ncbi:MAG: MFS transporter [Pseudomonadota bacterium]
MLPPALSHAPFRLYLAGNFAGLHGVWILRVAAAWLAWDLTGSAAVTGAVAFLNFAPTLVSGPLFGVMADRLDPRRGIMVTQSLQALIAFGLFALLAAGALTVPALLAVSLAVGVAASAYHPMRMALTPRLVPGEHLGQAVAMTAVNFNLTRMLGPALGGWLIAGQGAGAAVLTGGLLFLPQVAAFARLSPYPPAPREARAGPGGLRGFLGELTDGARHVLARPPVRDAMLLTGVSAIPARGALELLPVAADGLYGRGAAGFGALTALAGAGAVVAALWLARGSPSAAAMRARALVAAAGGMSLVVLLGLSESWWAAVAAVAGLGFCGTTVGVSNQTIAQVLTEDGWRGRVMSLWILVAIGGTSLGALGIGALGDVIGFRAALVAVALAATLPLGWLALRGR